MTSEKKFFDTEFEIHALGDDGTIEGYGSVFDVKDGYRDSMEKGCFRKSLRKRGASKVKMLYQHDSGDIIGKWTQMKEDDKGLYCKGQLLLKLQRAQEVYELLKESVLDGLSIGFRTVVDEWNTDTRIRIIKEVDLFEVSLVTFPANQEAVITNVKENGEFMPSVRDFEGILRDAGFSRKKAQTIISQGYAATLRDAEGAESDDLKELLSIMKQSTKTLEGFSHGSE